MAVLGFATIASTATTAHADEMKFMQNMKAGECYMRLSTKPQYETVTEKVTVKEPSERLEIIPAKYKKVQETIVVKDASFKLEKVAAEYKMVSEEVMISPAREEWKISRGDDIYAVMDANGKPITRVGARQGETLCKVKVPAKFKTVKKRVMVTPPSTRRIEIPAVTRVITKRVVVEEAKEQRISIPGKYRTISKTRLVSPGGVEWVPVLCRTNMTKQRLTDIQVALNKLGYYPGPIDGIFGKDTMHGIGEFQKDKGLTQGGITTETLKALGVSLGQ